MRKGKPVTLEQLKSTYKKLKKLSIPMRSAREKTTQPTSMQAITPPAPQVDRELLSIHNKLADAINQLAGPAALFEATPDESNAQSNRIAALASALAANMQVIVQKAQLDQVMAAAAMGITPQQMRGN